MLRLCFLLIITHGFIACNMTNNDASVIATAYGKHLHKSDLEWPNSKLQKSDSTELQAAFVNNWLINQIMIREAKSQIKDKEQLNKLVDKYENSIYINALEKSYIADNLDTNIESSEIDTFYAIHKDQLVLTEPIIKLLLVKIPNEYYQDTLKMIWKTEDIPALNTYVNKNNGISYLDVEKWHYKSEIKSIIPPDLFSKIDFSKKEMYSYDMDGQRYLVKILDRLKASSPSPKTFIESNIRSRILHERSIQLLNNWKQELYQSNIQSKNIHIAESY